MYICGMKNTIKIFSELGARLRSIPQSVISAAEEQNEWFCQIDVAIDALCRQMLDRDKLIHWLDNYPNANHTPKRVGIIMAGNIPAVGFADLLYTIAAGDIPVVKYSSKDHVLMEYIVDSLLEIEPKLTIEQMGADSVIDALIATGSDSAALHFRTMYGDIPTLIRGSRHSIAVLTGGESREDIEALQRDIFTYSGLGCRNVSLLFAPKGFDFTLSVPTMPEGYNNNYRHTRALMTMQGKSFTDIGGAITVEGDALFPRHISCINIYRYDSISEVERWIEHNNSRLQCVVSNIEHLPRSVKFGMAQYPRLNDYADDVDVMKFLLNLQ